MNHKIFVFSLILSCLSTAVFAQGYWDKDRATTKEIVLSARDRIAIPTEDFPVGTTEVVYRITLLGQNQEMANSLVSVLKSIPDPTGISQGSAGAVFLLSKISGDDKCQYALFTSKEQAKNYKDSGKTDQSCFEQNEAVSKDAKRLSLDKSSCLKPNTTTIWFGFESKNWLMNQKIVLEVVPWVDVKLNRGWSQDRRKELLSQCKTSNLAQKMTNSDDFCICILDKIQNKYRFDEFQKLLISEKNKTFKDFGDVCYSNAAISKNVYNDLRKQAYSLQLAGKYAEAISTLLTIVNDDKATALDYNSIGYCYILTKQYDKALNALKKGATLDDTELLIKLNLAHAYLVNDEYKNAKPIYKKYQTQNVTDSLGWIEKVNSDFELFKKAKLPSKDFDKVLHLFDN